MSSFNRTALWLLKSGLMLEILRLDFIQPLTSACCSSGARVSRSRLKSAASTLSAFVKSKSASCRTADRSSCGTAQSFLGAASSAVYCDCVPRELCSGHQRRPVRGWQHCSSRLLALPADRELQEEGKLKERFL